jgi:hypothetical protein
LGAKQLWKIKAPSKCRFFLWLVLHGRCRTSERLQQHGLANHGNCALCAQEPESLDHLLLHCVYSREIWFCIFRRRGWLTLLPTDQDSTIAWWLASRKRISKVCRPLFDSVFALVVWRLWNERNERIFRSTTSLPHRLVDKISDELRDWSNAGLVANRMDE